MTKTCLRCGHTWLSRVDNPKACPNCKSPKWNVARSKEKCAVCGEEGKELTAFEGAKLCEGCLPEEAASG